jgi:cardiolipin synthase A/B
MLRLRPSLKWLTKWITIVGAVAVFVTMVALFAYNLAPDRRELRDPVPHAVAAGTPAFQRTLTGLFGSPALSGNAIDTLVNGDQIFPAMLSAIESAEVSVNFETYVYWSGKIAWRFAETLAERAQAGVPVRVLIDWQGSVPMDAAIHERMQSAGVRVERFRPPRWYTLDRMNNRTHRKLLIVDGRIGFTGGVGIGDEWLGNARYPNEWRETHYRVTGPIVATMQAAFVDNWTEATGELLQGDAFFPSLAPSGPIVAQMIASNSGERNVMHLMLMTALTSANRSIRIGTPYFVPDDIALAQLLKARRRGVDIDILVPGPHMNKQLVRSASRHFWGDLLAAGARIHEYQPTMYHPKIVIVDETWTTIGSANFDERSFRLNDEANVNVFDTAFARHQAAMFDADIALAREISHSEWRNRPWRQRLTDWAWSWLRVQM